MFTQSNEKIYKLIFILLTFLLGFIVGRFFIQFENKQESETVVLNQEIICADLKKIFTEKMAKNNSKKLEKENAIARMLKN